MNREMMNALEADGEKLRQLTGENHGPEFLDPLAPCPKCGGDGGFEEAGSGKWSVCTFCDGTGSVESEAAESERDFDERFADIPDAPPFRHFTDEESAAWERVFAGVFCPACDAWIGSGAEQHICPLLPSKGTER